MELAVPLARSAFFDEDLFDAELAMLDRYPRPVAHVDALATPGSWVRSSLPGSALVTVRTSALDLLAMRPLCQHRGTLLCDGAHGKFDALEIRCPYHGWVYGTDGVRFAPSAPEGSGDRLNLETFATRTVFGEVFVGPELHKISLPPWLRAIEDEPLVRAPLVAKDSIHEVRANWKLVVENFQESHHFPFVHPSLEERTSWKDSESLLPEDAGELWLGGEMRFREGVETVSESGKIGKRKHVGVKRTSVLDAYVFPLWLTSLQPDYLLSYRLTPLAPNRTEIAFDILVHPRSIRVDLEDLRSFWVRTNAEDRAICERQQLGLELGRRSGARNQPVASEDGLLAFEHLYVREMRASLDR
ncbi:MAG: SRPBCC family protein [Polyangiaceae bacterium]